MKPLAGLLCVGLACLPAAAKEEKAPRRDGAWVAEQLTAWDLTREGAPSFRMMAKLEVLGEQGWTTGTYALTWVSPGRWREEIRFPGHEETEGMNGDIRWHQRPTRYRPRLPALLTSAVRRDRFAQMQPMEFRQPKPKKGSPALACLGDVCVDASTGELRTLGLREMSLQFASPAAFPLRAWPATWRLFEDGREIGRASVEKLETLSSVEPSEFDPPAGAPQIPACAWPTAPRVILATKVKPVYPKTVQAQRVEGSVRIRATIAADGTVQDLQLSWSPHPELARVSMDAVRQWRYEPARCGDLPVPVELLVSVGFDLK